MLHHRLMQWMEWFDDNRNQPLPRWIDKRLQISWCLQDQRLESELWGIRFPNPLGLAAGFDKDGIGTRVWGHLGFGFAELGTVTWHPQPGNPKPRLFRLPADQAALNRMGFNNQGAVALAARLQTFQDSLSQEPASALSAVPLGINLGKSKITPLDEAAQDYLQSFRLLQNLGDYFVVNVSSPNTPGLRSLQSAGPLGEILSALQAENQGRKPLLVKIAPDLDWEAIATVLELADDHNLAGIIATNTTIRRDGLNTQVLPVTGNPITEEAGGISGAPLRQRATDVIRFIYQETAGKLPIIGVGGIFTAADAWDKITAGASLLQVYTGWIYEGPLMPKRVMAGLLQRLEEQGMKSIVEAIGVGKV
jgi:dihydroorotate dehydrogenase